MDEIFDIISSFDRAQRIAFEKYVLSPYFVTDKKTADLILQIANEIYQGESLENLIKKIV